MNTPEIDGFEAELRRLAPARPPQVLAQRLLALAPHAPTAPLVVAPPRACFRPGWSWLRLGVPTAAAAALVLWLGTRWFAAPPQPQPPVTTAPARPVLEADGIEFDHHLVAAYDAVAEMPGGEPVRFRCREWMDGVVLRDSIRGLVLEERRPRFEAVPVRFETD
jgi:hypothetical protein